WWCLTFAILGSAREQDAAPAGAASADRPASPAGRRWLRSAIMLGLFATVGLIMLVPTYTLLSHEAKGFSNRSEALPRDVATYDNALELPALGSAANPALPLLWEPLRWQGRRMEPIISGLYMSGLCVWLA